MTPDPSSPLQPYQPVASDLAGSQTDWLATLYVLGELSTEEAALFEERLLDDLAACDAVAHASRLVMASHAVFSGSRSLPVTSEKVVERSGRRNLNRVWAGSGLAAAIALALVLWNGPVGQQPLPQDVAALQAESRRAADLLGSWRTIDLEAMEADALTMEDFPAQMPPANSASPDALSHADSLSHNSDSEDVVPDWMFAALLASDAAHETDDDQPTPLDADTIPPRTGGVIQ
jgi:anti-sigma factor RsiW